MANSPGCAVNIMQVVGPSQEQEHKSTAAKKKSNYMPAHIDCHGIYAKHQHHTSAKGTSSTELAEPGIDDDIGKSSTLSRLSSES